jgi:hypothetical protein
MPPFEVYPTLLVLFNLAERLNKTLPELVEGQGRPMDKQDLSLWLAYLQRRNQPKKPIGGGLPLPTPKTMTPGAASPTPPPEV